MPPSGFTGGILLSRARTQHTQRSGPSEKPTGTSGQQELIQILTGRGTHRLMLADLASPQAMGF